MKPILFSTQMVKAIIDGRKSQTRRIIKLPKDWNGNKIYPNDPFGIKYTCNPYTDLLKEEVVYRSFAPYEIGDILWVRETWRIVGWANGDPFKIQYKDGFIKNNVYLPEERAENIWIECTDKCIEAGFKSDKDGYFNFKTEDCPTKWKPGIFMFKECARIFLKIKNIRVEKLQNISEEDAMAEGINLPNYAEQAIKDVKYPEPSEIFMNLWDSINGKKNPWVSNPWVYVYDFELNQPT